MRSDAPAVQERPRILVVDDELGPRESLRMILKDRYDVVLTEWAEEGIESVKRGGVDLVLLDLKMKRMGGIQALEKMKEIDPAVPVVILTGYGTLETAQRAIRLGASDYVSKPFDVDELTRTVEAILDKRREEKEKGQTLQRLKTLNNELDDEVSSLKKLISSQKMYSSLFHDICGPITSVLGYVQILLMEMEKKTGFDEKDRDVAQKYLRIIENEMNRCRLLFRGFSSMAKSERTGAKAPTLTAVVDEILLLLKPQLAARNIRAEEMLAGSTSMMPVGNSQIKQVLLNLCINAVHAMDAGGTLAVSAREMPGGCVEIVVADTGCGMDEATLRRAFQPFFTTKAPEIGSGLGLSISKEIIEKCGGRIEIVSMKESGTRVILTLPSSALSRPAADTPA